MLTFLYTGGRDLTSFAFIFLLPLIFLYRVVVGYPSAKKDYIALHHLSQVDQFMWGKFQITSSRI